MSTPKHNVSKGKADAHANFQSSNFTQQSLLEKFGLFMERAFQNDPSLKLYMKEWESFRNLLKSVPLDYDKIYAYISNIQAAMRNISLLKTCSEYILSHQQ